TNAVASASCTQTITVTDQPPTVVCPASITVPATSPDGASVSFAATASDDCGSVSLQYTAGGQVITSPHTFPVGTTKVTCTATDANGNTNPCSFGVTVTTGADLKLDISAPSSVVTGSNLSYNLLVTNLGAQSAAGVVLTNPVPAGTTFVSA